MTTAPVTPATAPAPPGSPPADPQVQAAAPQAGPPAPGAGMRKVVKVRLELLKEHPLQRKTYNPPTEADLKTLADDMSRNGQHDPVHVMPKGNAAGLAPGTLLDGHSRLAAARLLGWTHIDAVVRQDLKNASAEEVEGVYLMFNFNRRQLEPLEQARIARRLYEIERKRPPGKLRLGEARDARDRVGKMFRPPISGRTLDRHWNILGAPVEVQRAFSAGRLKIGLAEKVGRMKPAEQAEVVGAIEAAGDGPLNAAVQRLVDRVRWEKRWKPAGVTPVAEKWLKQAIRGLDAWEAKARQAHGPTMAKHRDDLVRVRAVVNALIAASRKPQAPLPKGLLKAMAAGAGAGQRVRR